MIDPRTFDLLTPGLTGTRAVSRISRIPRIHTPRVVDRSPHALRPPSVTVVVRPQRRQPTRPACRQVRQSQRQDAQGKPTRDEHHRRGRGSCHSLERCACAICAPNPVLARHAAARVPGASARLRSACEIAPRHCVRVACLVRSLENKHAGSQRQYGNNVARGSAFESAVLEHRRLLPDQANTVPFVALGAHLLRCNPSNHARPYVYALPCSRPMRYRAVRSMASAQWTCVSVCLHSCMLLRGS